MIFLPLGRVEKSFFEPKVILREPATCSCSICCRRPGVHDHSFPASTSFFASTTEMRGMSLSFSIFFVVLFATLTLPPVQARAASTATKAHKEKESSHTISRPLPSDISHLSKPERPPCKA